MKCSFGISDFLEEISSLSHSVVKWGPQKAFGPRRIPQGPAQFPQYFCEARVMAK